MAGSRTSYASLRDARIVVVGAGVIGSTIAYRLSQAGANVTLVDRRPPGTGTSGASFAWLNAFRKPPREYHRLNAASIREHRDLCDELAGDWLHLDGALVWCDASDVEFSQVLAANERTLRSWGYRCEVATPEEVMRDLEPDLRIDTARVDRVYVLPNEGWIDAPRLTHVATQTAVRRHGLEIIRAAVAGMHGSGQGVDTVTLADGRELAVDVVVNAAGPDAGRVAELAGAHLELDRQPGAFAVTSAVPNCLRHVVRGPDAFVRPDGGSRLVIHRDEYDGTIDEGTVVGPEHALATRALADATKILPAVGEARVETMRLGVRAMPKDGYPIVGHDEGVPGMYHVATHSGVTLCARLALLVTDDLSGVDVPELAAYRPSRFSTIERGGVVPAGE